MYKSLWILALVFGSIFAGSMAHAVDQISLTLTDDQIEKIRNSCVDTQTTLSAVHNTDAVARINLGQQFEDMSSLLMAPMNSRVAINKLNGVAMAATTVDFNNELKNFSQSYSDYEKTLSGAIALRCYDQPVEFYDAMTLALQKRVAMRASADKLTRLMDQYHAQVAEMQKQALPKGAES